MKHTPENKVKKALKSFLDSLKPEMCYYSASAGAFSVGGVSDIICCYRGCFLAIEVKAPNRRTESARGLSALQLAFFKQVVSAGGAAIVFDGGLDDWNDLRNWINSVNSFVNEAGV